MSNLKKVKKLQNEIDAEKVKQRGKKKSHHLTRITGLPEPMEFVVCTDGTEIAYTKAEEKQLTEARILAFQGE